MQGCEVLSCGNEPWSYFCMVPTLDEVHVHNAAVNCFLQQKSVFNLRSFDPVCDKTNNLGSNQV